jgi:DNA repair protein RadA/Sms
MSPLKGAQCTSCKLWNFPKAINVTKLKTLADVVRGKERKLDTIPCGRWAKMFSEKGELVLSTLTALGGSPGAGKSTLICHMVGELNEKSVYVLAEEGEEPVADRADRLGISIEKQGLVTTVLAIGNQDIDLEGVIKATGAKVLFVDSISLLADDSSMAVEYCKYLKSLAVKYKLAVILTVHVTKDGGIAGLMALQHVVDCTMTFFPDESQPGVPRILHVEKNRNGPAYVSQVFLMKKLGLEIIAERDAMEALEN